MKRSPGPTPSSPLITIRARSDSASSRSTRCCMRSVSTSRGFCTPGRSTRTSWRPASMSVAMPRIARRVVCGRIETIATWLPTIALTSVDLPTLGRPASPMKPERGSSQPLDHALLQGEHLARRRSRGRSRRGAGRRGPRPRSRRCSARGRSPRRRARAGRRSGRRRRPERRARRSARPCRGARG